MASAAGEIVETRTVAAERRKERSRIIGNRLQTTSHKERWKVGEIAPEQELSQFTFVNTA
jgi:hypothetical protein